MKYYAITLEQVLIMSAYQFFCLLDEMQYLEDPNKMRPVSQGTIRKLETQEDFAQFFFG